MEHTLATFCGLSGQRVNKSRLWFSPNTPLYLRNSICSEFGVLPSTDLGMYLGAPLIHGRLRCRHFQFLLDKASRRLAGWKTKLLSRAARTTLIVSTLTTLPFYSMQTALIPRSVLHHLDKMSHGFFWAETAGVRKLHTIAWATICTPKKQGGLGLPNLQLMNNVLLAKLIWRLVKFPDELGNRILQAKYGGWSTLVQGAARLGCSRLWKDLSQVSPLLFQGLH